MGIFGFWPKGRSQPGGRAAEFEFRAKKKYNKNQFIALLKDSALCYAYRLLACKFFPFDITA